MSGLKPALPPVLGPDGHKGRAGRVLAVCGSRLMPGAAILVARAAQRAGTGITTLGCLDPELLDLLPVAVPEAVLADLSDAVGRAGYLSKREHHAALAGPGLGDTGRTRELVAEILDGESGGSPLVLDADALNSLAGDPERMAGRSARPLVITPHPGEATRLLGRPVPADSEGREAAARELAERSGAIVCLKGARTVVTDGVEVHVNDTGNPGMATAGSGDVLAGILLAYLGAHRAAPSDPAESYAFEAAAAAVRVHGLAGDLAAAELGVRAVTASDLVDHLPAAQLAMEAGGGAAC